MYLYKTIGLNPGESQIGFTGNYFIASNALNGNFNNAIFTGKFLSDEIKNSVKLNGDNVFGSGSNGSYTYSFRSSKDTLANKSTSYIFGVADKRYTDIAFNDDYFNLLFYGNSNLDTAKLDGFNFSLLTYQKIFAGVSKMYSFNNFDLSLYGGLALLKGQRTYSLDINKGFVNTSEFGEEISVGLDYSYTSSDTTNYGIMDWNGTGVSADFVISINSINKNTQNITLGIYNLGTILWNSESLNVDMDTSFSYSGQEVADFLDFSTNDFSALNEDSLLNDFYHSKSSKDKYSTRTPAQIFFNYSIFFSSIKTNLSLGAKHLLFSNMKIPYSYIRTSTIFSDHFVGIIQLADGGYGRFQVGLGCNILISKKLNITLFSSNVQGFLHNENTYNQGAYISASYKF